MKIGIIDADLLGRSKHRFPNLVCEKISSYHKDLGDEVTLLRDYDHIDEYDEVYISKVFTDTPVPDWISKNVDMDTGKVTLPEKYHVGGTGFFFAHAPNLPEEIEHHMPDYDLYNEWIEEEVERARAIHDKKEELKYQKFLDEESDNKVIYNKKPFNERNYRIQFKEYTDYSIGFITRGCFRKCPFCVNQKYDHVFLHSPLSEFHDPKRKKICLLDDNVLGCGHWKDILNELIATGKPFRFKQGMDERLLTDEKCKMLFNANYDGDYIFAFDNVEDYDLIEKKLQLIRKYSPTASVKFYVLVGFRSTDHEDIENMWKRVKLLMEYQCLPYIMRYQNKNETPWKDSKYRGLYVNMARWCNQPCFYKKKSFREFCEANQANVKTEGKICAALQSMRDFEAEHPEIAKEYFDLRYDQVSVIEELKEIKKKERTSNNNPRDFKFELTMDLLKEQAAIV